MIFLSSGPAPPLFPGALQAWGCRAREQWRSAHSAHSPRPVHPPSFPSCRPRSPPFLLATPDCRSWPVSDHRSGAAVAKGPAGPGTDGSALCPGTWPFRLGAGPAPGSWSPGLDPPHGGMSWTSMTGRVTCCPLLEQTGEGPGRHSLALRHVQSLCVALGSDSHLGTPPQARCSHQDCARPPRKGESCHEAAASPNLVGFREPPSARGAWSQGLAFLERHSRARTLRKAPACGGRASGAAPGCGHRRAGAKALGCRRRQALLVPRLVPKSRRVPEAVSSASWG